MSDEQVVLQIGSDRHTGWQEVRIRLSLEQIADEFELTLTGAAGASPAMFARYRPTRPARCRSATSWC